MERAMVLAGVAAPLLPAVQAVQRRGQWWLPASWFLVPPDEARAKIGEVRAHADPIWFATLSSPASHGPDGWWGAWQLRYAEILRWETESRDKLSGIGPELHDAPVILAEGNAWLRELRGWRAQAISRGVNVPGEMPPDWVDLGVTEVRRSTLYWIGGAAILGLAGLAYLKAER